MYASKTNQILYNSGPDYHFTGKTQKANTENVHLNKGHPFLTHSPPKISHSSDPVGRLCPLNLSKCFENVTWLQRLARARWRSEQWWRVWRRCLVLWDHSWFRGGTFVPILFLRICASRPECRSSTRRLCLLQPFPQIQCCHTQAPDHLKSQEPENVNNIIVWPDIEVGREVNEFPESTGATVGKWCLAAFAVLGVFILGHFLGNFVGFLW